MLRCSMLAFIWLGSFGQQGVEIVFGRGVAVHIPGGERSARFIKPAAAIDERFKVYTGGLFCGFSAVELGEPALNFTLHH